MNELDKNKQENPLLADLSNADEARKAFIASEIFNRKILIIDMATTYMTASGLQKLKEELQHLESVERPRVIAAIAEAREKGDLSENAEYAFHWR